MKANLFNWSKHPGCFERHLQRRHDNVLFSMARRNISVEDLEFARHQDDKDNKPFLDKYNNIISRLLSTSDVLRVKEADELYRQVVSLIEFSYAIAGDLSEERGTLLTAEESLHNQLTKAIPEIKTDLAAYESLSKISRIPWLAQVSRPDSPIPKDEETPALLCEDLESVRNVGKFSTAFEHLKNLRSDIIKTLNAAYEQGFDKRTGQGILNAFDEGNKSRG